MFDGEAFGSEIVDAVKAYVDRATAPLLARIAELEARAPAPGTDGKDGADGKDAAPITEEQVAAQVAVALDAAVARALEPREGFSNPVAVQVQRWLEANPPAPGKDGADGNDGAQGQPGEKGESGADGIGLAAALIDKDGNLVVTNTRGDTFALGRVVGSDGATGKDGERGADGCDGFSLDDFDTELKEDGRTVVFKFARGEVTEFHEMQFPVVIDRGVYKDGSEYAKGDAATWAGSLWIAQRDTTTKPGDGDDWRLAVKKGRDGRDGKDGAPGPQGKAGAPGKDGRAW